METVQEIIIRCEKASPRLKYVAGFFSSATGVNFTPVTEQEFNGQPASPGHLFLHYSDKMYPDAFTIFASGFLDESGIRPFVPAITKHQGGTILFPASNVFNMPLDIFSAAFYLLSRYEEYQPYSPDRHGRYEAGQSVAYQYGFLEDPVIDQWIVMLKKGLESNFPMLKFPKQEFRFVNTIDIDNPWAFLYKGIPRTAAGLAKQLVKLKFSDVRHRIRVLNKKEADPYDTYDYIRQTEQKYNFRSIFFLLSGNYGRFDTNYALDTPFFRKLVDNLKAERMLGIHPSYRSNHSMHLLKFEFNRFARFLGKPPEISRQHFLMLHLPATYRHLISLNIHTDYSMGYASHVGFRAGTSLPFRFFDLHLEKETPLLVHPFAIMDVTLRQYLSLGPAEAINKITLLMEKTKAVNGIFTGIWHNESLSEYATWKGWRKVFEEMAAKGTKQ